MKKKDWCAHYEGWIRQRTMANHMSDKPPYVDWHPGNNRWSVFDHTYCGEIICDNGAAGIYLDDPEKL